MTDRPEDDRDLLAAEYVLGLLDADGRAQAGQRFAAEPGFAAAVAAWEARLAPLTETLPPATPPDAVRARIMAVAFAANDDGRRETMSRSRGRWRAFAAGASGVAAALAMIVAVQTMRAPPEPRIVAAPAPRPVLVASLSSADTATSLAIAYDGTDSMLTVSPGQVRPATGHDHQLWIIPEGGTATSLGLVRAGATRRIEVPRDLAPHFRREASLALSVEPVGGSPTGRPTGAVVASGRLNEI